MSVPAEQPPPVVAHADRASAAPGRLANIGIAGEMEAGTSDSLVSVVIPTHNRWSQLRRVLDGYARQTMSPGCFEVIVCDDASTDNTAACAEALGATLPFRLRVLRQDRKGPAAARNLGAAMALAPLLIFTDDDCVPDQALLATHHGSTRAGVATIGHIEWHPELTVTPFMDFVCPGYMFNFGQITDREHATYQCFYTANASIHRDDFIAVGRFDEGFPAAAYEDIELGYRLETSGVRLRYEPGAVIYHLHEMTLAAQLPRQRLNGHAAAYAIHKHPRMLLGAGRVIRLRDPGLRRRYYDAVLDYYYVAGLQEALEGATWVDGQEAPLAESLDDRLREMASDYEVILEHKFYEAERYARQLEDQLARLEVEYQRVASWAGRLDDALQRANPLKNALRARLPMVTRLLDRRRARSRAGTP